ncbi:hypothetical protein GCM10009578_081720 [Streptomyces rhizosphaericus]
MESWPQKPWGNGSGMSKRSGPIDSLSPGVMPYSASAASSMSPAEWPVIQGGGRCGVGLMGNVVLGAGTAATGARRVCRCCGRAPGYPAAAGMGGGA